MTIQKSLIGFFSELEKIAQDPMKPGPPGGSQSVGTPPTVVPSGGADIPSGPGAGEMGGGATASSLGIPGGNPMGGGTSAAPPPPAPSVSPVTSGPSGGSSGGPSAGSLLSPQRQKGFGTGSLSASESAATAAPSAAEFGG